LRLVLIVPATTKGDVLDRGRSSLRAGVYVMELEETPLGAPVPRRRDEGAPSAIALPDRAPDPSRNVRRRRRGRADVLAIRLTTDRRARPRPRRDAPLLVLDLRSEERRVGKEGRGWRGRGA